jgi:hypothetical protein
MIPLAYTPVTRTLRGTNSRVEQDGRTCLTTEYVRLHPEAVASWVGIRDFTFEAFSSFSYGLPD